MSINIEQTEQSKDGISRRDALKFLSSVPLWWINPGQKDRTSQDEESQKRAPQALEKAYQNPEPENPYETLRKQELADVIPALHAMELLQQTLGSTKPIHSFGMVAVADKVSALHTKLQDSSSDLAEIEELKWFKEGWSSETDFEGAKAQAAKSIEQLERTMNSDELSPGVLARYVELLQLARRYAELLPLHSAGIIKYQVDNNISASASYFTDGTLKFRNVDYYIFSHELEHAFMVGADKIKHLLDRKIYMTLISSLLLDAAKLLNSWKEESIENNPTADSYWGDMISGRIFENGSPLTTPTLQEMLTLTGEELKEGQRLQSENFLRRVVRHANEIQMKVARNTLLTENEQAFIEKYETLEIPTRLLTELLHQFMGFIDLKSDTIAENSPWRKCWQNHNLLTVQLFSTLGSSSSVESFTKKFSPESADHPFTSVKNLIEQMKQSGAEVLAEDIAGNPVVLKTRSTTNLEKSMYWLFNMEEGKLHYLVTKVDDEASFERHVQKDTTYIEVLRYLFTVEKLNEKEGSFKGDDLESDTAVVNANQFGSIGVLPAISYSFSQSSLKFGWQVPADSRGVIFQLDPNKPQLIPLSSDLENITVRQFSNGVPLIFTASDKDGRKYCLTADPSSVELPKRKLDNPTMEVAEKNTVFTEGYHKLLVKLTSAQTQFVKQFMDKEFKPEVIKNVVLSIKTIGVHNQEKVAPAKISYTLQLIASSSEEIQECEEISLKDDANPQFVTEVL